MVDVSRGGIVESFHEGVAAVANVSGDVLTVFGSEDYVTFLRSSAKPFQAIPLIESGAAAHYGFSDRQIAVICASHAGSDEHVEVTHSILQKIGLKESDLRCGTHPPSDRTASRRLIAAGEDPTPLRHNCSGKHAGMLALARYIEAPIQTYLEPENPVQQLILNAFAEMVSMKTEDIIVGIDGCSAPNFAVPIGKTATAYARLMDPAQFSSERAESCRTIVRAMTSYPEMVSGEGRFDTQLMQVTSTRMLSKGGAEGYQGLGIPSGSINPGSPALGVAIKVLDGDTANRARPVAAISVLNGLGVLPRQEREQLKRFDSRILFNQSDLPVGEIRTSETFRSKCSLPDD
jgi:L-asparaginase II